MDSHLRLLSCICAGVLMAALLGIAANAAPVTPGQSAMNGVNALIKVQTRKPGPGCCRTTLRCVRKSAGQCKEWKVIVTPVCPGVICR